MIATVINSSSKVFVIEGVASYGGTQVCGISSAMGMSDIAIFVSTYLEYLRQQSLHTAGSDVPSMSTLAT